MRAVRLFLSAEVLAFWMASLVHAGILLRGYEHRPAMVAEGVIGAVLVLGLLMILMDARSTRIVGSVVQGFALLGTLVGIFTTVIGVGPHSRFDVALHGMFVVLLVSGMAIAGSTGRPVYD
jgi:flagellar motor component MotA